MKKLVKFAIPAALSMLIAAPLVQAQTYQYGSPTTVSQAKTMRDDSRVILEGTLGNRISKDEFMFSDGTGSIVVDLDDDDDIYRMGLKTGHKVRIYGDVDTHRQRAADIDVERVEIIQ